MSTVLFIEDNADIRENMGEILELANYHVLLAPDGKKGVELALSEKPDIIICDIMMPELDGYGVIHLLQKNEATRHIPFIFLTAKAERWELRKGMELGADDYITKPFSGTELLQAIEGRLKKAAAQRLLQTDTAPGEEQPPQGLHELFDAEEDIRAYRKKEQIYHEGQRAFRLYCVREGKVKLFRSNDDGKDLITGICQEGDFFGYTALLEGVHYKETAETLEPSSIASIPKEAFDRLLNDNPEVVREFVRLLAGNVHEKEAQLLGIAYNSLRKKVAEALLRLYRKYRQDGETETVLQVSRENLAAIAGTAKESLIRTLGDFREEGLIGLRGSDILILQEEKLAGMIN